VFVGLVAAAAVVTALVLVGVLFVQRGREGLELTPRNLLRTYLYAGSFGGLAALVFGIAAIGNFALAAVAGNDVVYGAPPVPRPAIAPACPPNFPNCPQPPPVEELLRRQAEQTERRRNEDLLRGITFTVFGGLFYAAHYVARRALLGADEAQSGARRAYLMVGTAVFGLATIVLVPTGLYQLLANAILPTTADTFRPAVADSLMPGLVSLIVWLLFLRLVVTDFRRGMGA
jgi:hypothetical protein